MILMLLLMMENVSMKITCNGIEASVNIFTDLYASEMSWELLDADGGLVDSGSGFASDNSTNVCLVEGFIIYNGYDGFIW